ncbi:hypothetical protein C8F04DRAFT_1201162 [Mycena alexandri]|uniref:Uncharacterized protein n=1 Tax=Mycena alexandri TaxID=1745969 RepID=A0AAD6WMR6_9AGAR|nr:hypothetical protein C8F04DRAFT_1201162 [Mycena alexandri]
MARTVGRASSSSKKTATIGSSYPGRFGKHVPIKKVLMKSRTQQDKYRNARAEVQQARTRVNQKINWKMDRDELQALRDIQDWDGGVDGNEDQEIRLENVLDGSTRVDISHDGGELREAIRQEIEEEARRAKIKRPDWRTRQDRIKRRTEGSGNRWPTGKGEPSPDTDGDYPIRVVDLLDTYTLNAKLDSGGLGVAAALVKQGLFPCAPYDPTVAISLPAIYNLLRRLPRSTSMVAEWVRGKLGRGERWRQENACPACTYKLEGEPDLIFSMLWTMDGNESLRRVIRKERTSGEVDENGEAVPGHQRKERMEEMQERDEWAKAKVASMLPTDDIPMWGVFDETGIFPALGRHGFVLILVDMIEVVNCEFRLFLLCGGGYDIGCHFEATIRNSRLSERAQENALKMLVGAFHGHAHNRLCQLSFLATYIEGLGLEDLEGCERFFSKSNDLAKCANSSAIIMRQALDILRTESTLREWMRKEGIESGDVFKEWLKEEKEWLLQKKGSSGREVTLEMQYVQKLVNWSVCKTKLNTIRREYDRQRAADDNYDPATDLKRRRALQHASESLTQGLGLVQDLEDRLDIDPNNRWTSTSVEWIAAVKQLREKKFSDALDALELIVERIFELTKINRSQTGYKMRRHIAKALQTRSEAVKNAISRYNIAAASLEPTCTPTELGRNFDFLRATDGELLDKPWTRPAYRLAMDRYFKIIRAKEEIKRLNVEIRRFVTWMSDEDRFLRRQEEEAESPGEAALIRKHRMERGRFDAGHMERLGETKARGVERGWMWMSPLADTDREPDLGEDPPDEVREEDEEDDDEEEGEKEVAEIVYQLARLAVDGRVEQTVDEDVEVDPGHEDSGEEEGFCGIIRWATREQMNRQHGAIQLKNYKPDVILVHYAEYGRSLTPKEAWKALSHRFYGKGSGKDEEAEEAEED